MHLFCQNKDAIFVAAVPQQLLYMRLCNCENIFYENLTCQKSYKCHGESKSVQVQRIMSDPSAISQMMDDPEMAQIIQLLNNAMR